MRHRCRSVCAPSVIAQRSVLWQPRYVREALSRACAGHCEAAMWREASVSIRRKSRVLPEPTGLFRRSGQWIHEQSRLSPLCAAHAAAPAVKTVALHGAAVAYDHCRVCASQCAQALPPTISGQMVPLGDPVTVTPSAIGPANVSPRLSPIIASRLSPSVSRISRLAPPVVPPSIAVASSVQQKQCSASAAGTFLAGLCMSVLIC